MNRPYRASGGRFQKRHCTPVAFQNPTYCCAGLTRNRLTISYLTITAAQAFFQHPPPAIPKFQQLTNRTIFQLPPLSISISPQRYCPSNISSAHLRQHPKFRQHTTSCTRSPATHTPHLFPTSATIISGPRHRHQHPSSIFSLGVTPAKGQALRRARRRGSLRA